MLSRTQDGPDDQEPPVFSGSDVSMIPRLAPKPEGFVIPD